MGSKLQELEKQIARLEGQLQEKKRQQRMTEIREKARLQKIERAKDTRRKIILGAWVISAIKSGEIDKERLMSKLDRYLEREDDRRLFNLPPRRGN